MSAELGAVVYALDLDRMVAFYTRALGLAVEQRDEGFVVLACGDTSVTLVQVPPHIAEQFPVSDPPQRREDTPIKLSFAVPSIAAARAAAPAHGGVVDPAEQEWEFGQVRVCDGHDPEGNVVQVREAR